MYTLIVASSCAGFACIGYSQYYTEMEYQQARNKNDIEKCAYVGMCGDTVINYREEEI